MNLRCIIAGHDDAILDMVRGRHVQETSGRDSVTEITTVLLRCARCKRLHSQTLTGHFSIDRVRAAVEAGELEKLVGAKK